MLKKVVENKAVHHPKHYGGADNPYEAIKVIEAWGLGFHLGNTVKYISRAGKKDRFKELEDLEKAAWYLQRRIMKLRGSPGEVVAEQIRRERECRRRKPT